MLQVATFWLLLGVPGYALLRRFDPGAMQGGLLSGVALSYLCSFVLFAAVSIPSYAFGLPLAVLSTAIVIAVVAAGAWVLRDLVRSPPRLRPSLLGLLVSALVATDMVLGLRVGGYFSGDAGYHIARVKLLLAHGFNSWDPYVSGHRLDPVYHTNLYHALLAAAAQLTRQHAAEAWAFSWFFAKLLTAAATYHFAWIVLGRRWLAWNAAAMCVVFEAPLSMMLYPNELAPFALVPLALAATVEIASGDVRPRALLGLAAAALVLVQFHALYYVFLCIMAAPILLLLLARATYHRLPRRRVLALSLLALGCGAPWFGVKPLLQHAPGVAAAQSISAAPQAAPVTQPRRHPAPAYRADRGFVHLADGRLMLDPADLVNPRGYLGQLIVILGAGMFSRRRRQLAIVAAFVGVVIAVLYVPLICTLAVRVAGTPWIVRRLAGALLGTHLSLVPGVVFLLLAEHLWPAAGLLWRGAGHLVGLLGALATAYVCGVDSGTWTRKAYLRQALDSGNMSHVLTHTRGRQLFEQNIPEGASVVVPFRSIQGVLTDCDCYPLALPEARGSHGVPDMERRRADMLSLLSEGKEPARPERIAILHRYGVRHLYVDGRAAVRLRRVYHGMIEKRANIGRHWVLTLTLPQPVDEAQSDRAAEPSGDAGVSP